METYIYWAMMAVLFATAFNYRRLSRDRKRRLQKIHLLGVAGWQVCLRKSHDDGVEWWDWEAKAPDEQKWRPLDQAHERQELLNKCKKLNVPVPREGFEIPPRGEWLVEEGGSGR